MKLDEKQRYLLIMIEYETDVQYVRGEKTLPLFVCLNPQVR